MDRRIGHQLLVRWVRQHSTKVLVGAGFALLAFWEFGSSQEWWDTRDWSSPLGIIQSLVGVLLRGQETHTDHLNALPLWVHLGYTVLRWAVSFVLAALLGAAVGFGIGRSPILRALGVPVVNLLRGLPSAAIWPLCGLTLGYNLRSQVLVIVFGAIWPILINSARGAQAIPHELLDSIAFFRLNRLRRVRLLFRMSLPGVFTGLELGAGVAFLLTITVEWLHPSLGGLGFFLFSRKEASEQPFVLGGILLAALLGLGVNSALRTARERILPWEPGADSGPVSTSTGEARVGRRLRTTSRAVRDPDVRRVSEERTHVTERLMEVFPEGWRLEVLETACPPYIFPAFLERASAHDEDSDWYQRDIRIWATRSERESVVLFARSWIREDALKEASRFALRAGLETIGRIIRANEMDISYEDLGRPRILESQSLARAFKRDGVVELLERVRAIRVQGRRAILIQEFFPV